MPDHVHRSADRRAASEVDGVVCAIGSYNLDRRSLLLNWELSVLVATRRPPAPSTETSTLISIAASQSTARAGAPWNSPAPVRADSSTHFKDIQPDGCGRLATVAMEATRIGFWLGTGEPQGSSS